ncbi:MAG: GTP cyclohydrolase II RibA [Alsobacter sp.]
MSVSPSLDEMFARFDQTQVERAIAELRAGRPVVLREDGAVLVTTAEAAVGGLSLDLPALAQGQSRLVLAPGRLRRLGQDRQSAGVIALPTLDLGRIETLALRVDGKIDAPVSPATAIDVAGLDLAATSLLLPAVIVTPLSPETADALIGRGVAVTTPDALARYRRSAATSVTLVSRAPVPLEGAGESEFVVFRGGEGLRDQVAIVVGKPDLAKPVIVRLHSACLTGDLFGSLKCDCGDQLRGAVKFMAENGGGVLLYLDQEGRGNGIANKIRAYKLQSEGWDTYDADEVLGFGLDQRHFGYAAEMLKQLGVSQVAIMTNNPLKIAALKAAGLQVVDDLRLNGRPTSENVLYLAAKRDRAGHFIDLETLVARKPIQD